VLLAFKGIVIIIQYVLYSEKLTYLKIVDHDLSVQHPSLPSLLLVRQGRQQQTKQTSRFSYHYYQQREEDGAVAKKQMQLQKQMESHS